MTHTPLIDDALYEEGGGTNSGFQKRQLLLLHLLVELRGRTASLVAMSDVRRQFVRGRDIHVVLPHERTQRNLSMNLQLQMRDKYSFIFRMHETAN